jgi:hypothetical protein
MERKEKLYRLLGGMPRPNWHDGRNAQPRKLNPNLKSFLSVFMGKQIWLGSAGGGASAPSGGRNSFR